MALIKRKVGVGADADHAKWSDAWNYLTGIDPLGNDYEFKQISDITEDAWPDTTVNANKIHLNGHSIKFYCPWNDSHQGDPTRGYVTYLSGGQGQFRAHFFLDDLHTSVLRYENLYFRQITNNDEQLFLPAIRDGVGDRTLQLLTCYCNDILVRGYATHSSIALMAPDGEVIYRISNCKLWNTEYGLYTPATVLTPILPYDGRVNRNEFENITVFDTAPPAFNGAIQTRGTNVNQRICNFRNCCSIQAFLNRSWTPTVASNMNYIYNGANDDGSIAAMVWTGANNAVDCIPDPIVPADAFISLDDTNENFLKLIAGNVTAEGTADKSRGKAPLEVAFKSNINFNSPSILGKTGMKPTLQLKDISGNERPGDDNLYSIGAEELQYNYGSS